MKFFFSPVNRDHLQEKFRILLNPLVTILAHTGISANTLSLANLFFGACSGILLAYKLPLIAGLVILGGSLFDALDGQLARLTNTESSFGAVLDTVLDRYSEFFIYLGLFFYFQNLDNSRLIWELLILFSLMGSIMTSFTKAHIEKQGVTCRSGWLQRPERVLLLGGGLLLEGIFNANQILLKTFILILAIGTNYTVIQRILYSRKILANSIKK